MLNLWIQIAAWVSLVLFAVTYFLEPLLFGRERKPYSFGVWLVKGIIFVVLNLPILLRVLGFI